MATVWADIDGKPGSARRRQWHLGLMVRYERAALTPWLPVAPDPPEPE